MAKLALDVQLCLATDLPRLCKDLVIFLEISFNDLKSNIKIIMIIDVVQEKIVYEVRHWAGKYLRVSFQAHF